MSSVRSDRITVKIHNMKRSTSRDSPPRAKRRGSIGRYGDSSDEERMRRRPVARSPSPRHAAPRYASPPRREEYSRPRETAPPVERYSYKVLCVSAIHPKASDEFIKETLYREYKKFGDFSIRVSHDLEERVAYVCFRTSDDAREAKHAKPRIVLYDKIALVEPVYESVKAEPYRVRATEHAEYDRYYPPARGSPERRRPPAEHHPYDRYGPPVSMHHAVEYRPVSHHEFMPRGPPMHHHPGHLHHPGRWQECITSKEHSL
jgi:RNA-binding protein 15